MRALHLCLIAATSSVLGFSPASAQTKAAPKGASGSGETRYFTSIDGMMNGNADVILREHRQGQTVTDATLDVCYPAEAGSDRKDRFVVDLAVNGAAMTGTTTTLIDKYPVTVKLTRKQAGDNFEFKGQVSVGQTVNDVTSADNTDLSEQEYHDNQRVDDNLALNPTDFTDVSPEAIGVRVKLDSALDFIKSLRGEKVEIVLSSLSVTCEALRAGEQIINLNVAPERAAAFVAKVKAAPGVIAAGWTSGTLDLDQTIRFAAAGWRDGDLLNKDKIATTLAATLGKTLGAQLIGTTWDNATGRLKLQFKRPSQIIPSLNLTDNLEVSAVASPERAGTSDHLLLWVSAPAVTTTDETDGPKLTISNATSPEEEVDPHENANTIDALATAFKGQRWDNDKADWKK